MFNLCSNPTDRTRQVLGCREKLIESDVFIMIRTTDEYIVGENESVAGCVAGVYVVGNDDVTEH